MSLKDEIVDLVKKYIETDNKLLDIQRDARDLRKTKKEINDQLVEIMKNNDIDCFDVKDGKLQYAQTKTRGSINKKYLLTVLSKYFDNNNKAEDITEYILENREEKIKESIKRKINK